MLCFFRQRLRLLLTMKIGKSRVIFFLPMVRQHRRRAAGLMLSVVSFILQTVHALPGRQHNMNAAATPALRNRR